jgi:hypothetical protein
MPPETAKALQKHISRCQFCNQKIGIQIDALLDNLGRNKN